MERKIGEVWTEKIGEINIISSSCWIGDPANVIHPIIKHRELGRSWHEFVEALLEGSPIKQFRDNNGVSGLGICVPAGFGDGNYEVFAEIVQVDDGKHVKSVHVVFISDEEVEKMKTNG